MYKKIDEHNKNHCATAVTVKTNILYIILKWLYLINTNSILAVIYVNKQGSETG